jgi:hypothetical protein
MPFGRFKGVDLVDISDDYLEWLHGLDNLRHPLHTAVDDEWAARHAGTRTLALAPLAVDVRPVAEQLLTAGLRSLTQRHHPDRGGCTRAMQRVNAAAEWLRSAVRRAA